jgi:uncharacterized protein YdhG (YjbR/CyaY superfamily)
VARPTVSGVDEYIAKQPDEVQPVLQRVRRIIRKALPGAEETISYQIPTYKRDGQYVVYFAPFKQHWSLYPVTGVVRAQLKRELAAYEGGKGTVRFPLSESVPDRLVDRIVRKLAGLAQSRARAKTTKKARPKSGARRRTRR